MPTLRLHTGLLTIALASIALATAACGQGQVALQDDTGVGDEGCPALVLSAETVTFQDAYFDVGTQGRLQIDNRCAGSGALTLELVDSDDGGAFLFPGGPFDVAPGGRLTLDFTFVPPDYGSFEGSVTYRTNDPDQPEVTVILAGAASRDQDADGFTAVEVGGDDCDDSDAGIHPGRAERDDGQDQDCDGLVDEDFVRAGDVVITEIFAFPSSDPKRRQWFEVRNNSGRRIDLSGWTLASTELELVVGSSAVLEPGQHGVLARSADPDVVGVPQVPTGVLTGSDEFMTLVGGWTLTLAAGTNPVYILEGDGFPRMQEGYAIQLDGSIEDPFEATRGDRWCVATSPMPSGERGTPFEDNTWCAQVDHDGDGAPLSQDCDDIDPERWPGAAEVLDGIDNDCDGRTDRLEVSGGETASIAVLPWDRWWSFGAGDFDDDGQQDLLMIGMNSRRSYLLEVAGISGKVNLDRATVDSTSGGGWDPLPMAAPHDAEDVDGDGVDDIVIAAGSFASGGESAALQVSTDGDLLNEVQVYLTGEGNTLSDRGDVAVLDSDGDGVHEVFLGLAATNSWDGGAWLLDVESTSGRVDMDDVALQGLDGAAGRAGLGGGVATADLDDDGYDDFIIRDSGRFTSNGDTYLLAGAARTGSSGDIDDVADTILENTGKVNTTTPSARPMTGDVDGDGAIDLAVPSSSSVQIWFDASDLLTGPRAPDMEIISGAGSLCGVDLLDQDGDGKDGIVLGWSDATWGGNSAVSYFSTATLASAGSSLRASRDDDGRITSDTSGDLLGCDVFAADVNGSSAEDLFVAAPMRRTGSGSFEPTVWYFQAK